MAEKIKEAGLIAENTIRETFRKLDFDNQLSILFKSNPTVYFINLPAGFKGEEEVHESEDDLYYVFDGEAKMQIGGNDEIEIKKGDLLHIPMKVVHRLTQTKNGIKYIVIKMHGNKIV